MLVSPKSEDIFEISTLPEESFWEISSPRKSFSFLICFISVPPYEEIIAERGDEVNDLQIFNIEGVECYEKDGTAYLKLETVARGLGFTDKKDGIEYVRWARVDKYLSELNFATSGERPEFIPENVFYRLAMKAKNEVAEKFQTKVADEIIPSIRKHGGYISGQDSMSDDELLAKALLVAQSKIKEKQERIEKLTEEINVKDQVIGELRPKADYTDNILKNTGTVTITQIAKDYGMSAIEMNRLLNELGVQFKQSDQWLLYKKYHAKGYTHSETVNIVRADGHPDIKMNTKWTQKGRLFIYNLLKENGIVPVIERTIA